MLMSYNQPSGNLVYAILGCIVGITASIIGMAICSTTEVKNPALQEVIRESPVLQIESDRLSYSYDYKHLGDQATATFYLTRVKVPNGWVLTNYRDGGMVFVPDLTHEWLRDLKPEAY